MECDCGDWKENIERLNAPEIFIQTTRSYIMKPYPKTGQFKYCPWCSKKLCDEKRNAKGQFLAQNISLESSFNLGYFSGLVIGDGFITKRHGNYSIHLESTRISTVNIFVESALKLGLNPSKIYSRLKTRKFPNGTIKSNIMYKSEVNSRAFYDFILPYKRLKWSIPRELNTNDGKIGFLSGIYDAEGSVSYYVMVLYCKFKEPLKEVASLLREFDINTAIYNINNKKMHSLNISNLYNLKKFYNLISLKLKKEQLDLVMSDRIKKEETSIVNNPSTAGTQ